MPYALLAYNNSIHSFTKCRPIEVITGHFDPRDAFDVDLTAHLLQQYMTNHKDKMTKVYNVIQDLATDSRKELTDSRNKNREPKIEYSPEQQIYIRNPFASRQKLAPRFTHDVVMADLPIHIYTKKKRGPVAKHRLKRVPKSSNLLQSNPVNPPAPGKGNHSGNKT
jgi:hypothetical protein